MQTEYEVLDHLDVQRKHLNALVIREFHIMY